MTVVCTDGVTVAADSLMTFGNERALRPEKKIIVSGGCIYAASGVGVLSVLVSWHQAGADPSKLPVTGGEGQDGWWNLLVIEQHKISVYSKSLPYALLVDPPFAIGSGGDYAIGAMDYGASPQEAVAIAIRRSVNCGGEIQVVNIAEALGQLRQAAE